MELIIAKNNNDVIGDKGKMLWHIPGDMKYFRSVTENQIVIMGRKTFQSLPNGPLPNRINIVLTRQADKWNDTLTWNDPGPNKLFFTDLDNCEKIIHKIVQETKKRVIVIGGVEIYKLFLDKCDVFHITRVYDNSEGDTKMEIDDVVEDMYCDFVISLLLCRFFCVLSNSTL